MAAIGPLVVLAVGGDMVLNRVMAMLPCDPASPRCLSTRRCPSSRPGAGGDPGLHRGRVGERVVLQAPLAGSVTATIPISVALRWVRGADGRLAKAMVFDVPSVTR